jgi:hypothetical protein
MFYLVLALRLYQSQLGLRQLELEFPNSLVCNVKFAVNGNIATARQQKLLFLLKPKSQD